MNPVKKRNQLVQYITRSVAMILLAETETEPAIRSAAWKQKNQLMKDLPEAERILLLAITKTVSGVAQALANAQSLEALADVDHLLAELAAGRIVKVDDETAAILQAQADQLTNGTTH